MCESLCQDRYLKGILKVGRQMFTTADSSITDATYLYTFTIYHTHNQVWLSSFFFTQAFNRNHIFQYNNTVHVYVCLFVRL